MNGGALIKFSNSKEHHIYVCGREMENEILLMKNVLLKVFFDDERRVEINMSIENCRQLGSQLELKFDYN